MQTTIGVLAGRGLLSCDLTLERLLPRLQSKS